jgi:hypothetical protein
MALSAEELIGGTAKIIEVSHHFGYESPEAYTRAFKSFHGISPMVARKYGKFVEYPRISFQLKITGGHFDMGLSPQFEVYKDILLKMEIIEMPETLKFAGVTSVGLPNFQNIGVFHEKYKPMLEKENNPYTEIGLSGDMCKNDGWYIFGCLVDSIDNLPDGLVGVDTGLNKFACLTFRVQKGGDLVGGDDGPGEGMKMAGEYLDTVRIQKNRDKLYNYQTGDGHSFYEIKKSEKNYRVANLPMDGLEESYKAYLFEIYKTNIEEEPEMCYYLPLI